MKTCEGLYCTGNCNMTREAQKMKTVDIVKLVPEAVVPSYAKPGDAGLDLVAISMKETDLYIEYGLGLAMAIPEGYGGFILPRSSLSNYHLVLANHVGLIDSGYRGEITARFKKTNEGPNAKYYKVGDKICQMVILEVPKIKFQLVDSLSTTERGTGGYGSSGT